MKKLKKTIEVELELPAVPNFIRFGERKCLPLSQFTEKELRDIGAAWTEELVKKSRRVEKSPE